MKNTHTNKLNIKLFKKTLKKSLQSAFKSLSNDVGDNLFNFERLQLKEINCQQESIDKLAANLDELFLNQMNILVYKMDEEINQYILQERLYRQKFFEEN